MPSFDVSSEMDWQELSNAIQQTEKEVANRFDFKGVTVEFTADPKAKALTIWCSDSAKMDAVKDAFQTKAVKRGLSLLSFSDEKKEDATGKSVRLIYQVQSGISKEKAKEITKAIKESKVKVNAQIQDEQVRVTGKKRDDLQSVISFLKEQQDKIEVPMQFGNFRD